MSKLACVTAAMLTLLCACSKTTTYSTKEGTATVTDRGKDDESIHIAGKDGASVDINSGKPITEYPSDVPLYAGKAVMDMKSDKERSRMVTIQTADSLEKIVAFYKSELESKGWMATSRVLTPEMTVYSATKDDRKLAIQIGTEPGTNLRSISQVLANKEKQ